MNNYLSNLKIIQKFALIFSLILLAVIASYAVVFWSNSKQETQRVQIDIAGRNRMLSQRIGAMAMLLDTDNEAQATNAKEEMRKAIVLIEQTLNVLKDGGIAPGVEGDVVLPPAPAILLPKINEVLEFFASHKEICSIVLNESRSIESTTASVPADSLAPIVSYAINPKFKEASDKLRQRLINGTLLKMNVELTQQFTASGSDAKSVMAMLVVLLSVNIGIISFAFYFLRNTLKPLEPLTEHISILSSGHVPTSLQLLRNDEIGKMTSALNVLADNLGSTTEFAKNVGDGKLETTVQVFNGKGDLSHSLSAMRDNLKKVAVEDSKRNWATEGLAKFSDILRSNNDLKTLTEGVISGLVKYTKSNQGSLFILNDSKPADVYLELQACYAFDRKKFLGKKLLPGEGLAGQAFLEKETIFMNVVPKNYVTINSALGEGNPTAILIVPLKINGEVIGVVELASFKEYQPHEIAFVEKLAENIASTIIGVRINERTQQLLQASQQQAEEMRSQEEEMRQNMEELSATQEEMSRKENEYIRKIEGLEKKLAVHTLPADRVNSNS